LIELHLQMLDEHRKQKQLLQVGEQLQLPANQQLLHQVQELALESIDCAREIRGTSSSENAVTPADAAASIESTAVTGERNEIVIAPFFNLLI
jgi:hypothetical protein